MTRNWDAITWIVISNLLDISFIQGDIHSPSCKKSGYIMVHNVYHLVNWYYWNRCIKINLCVDVYYVDGLSFICFFLLTSLNILERVLYTILRFFATQTLRKCTWFFGLWLGIRVPGGFTQQFFSELLELFVVLLREDRKYFKVIIKRAFLAFRKYVFLLQIKIQFKEDGACSNHPQIKRDLSELYGLPQVN